MADPKGRGMQNVVDNRNPYNRVYAKPLSDDENRLLDRVDLSRIPRLPILDVACGYGRNGLYFVRHGYRVVFIDHDERALRDIRDRTDVDQDLIRVLKLELCNYEHRIPDRSCGGVILCDYYDDMVVQDLISMVAPGGFLLIKTPGNRGDSWKGKPEFMAVAHSIEDSFDIVYHHERTCKKNPRYASLSLLAYRR